jgi:ribosomal protein S1
VVLGVDATNQRISLGFKQLQDDPWSIIGDTFKVGGIVKGKVTKITAFGAFVGMQEGIDGLVHISQISDEKVERVKDVLSVGQEVEARIVKIDPVERKIGLSIKAAQISDDDFKVSDDMLEGLQAGEDLVDLAGAFDEAFGIEELEEWHPGDSAAKKVEEKPEAVSAPVPKSAEKAEEPVKEVSEKPKEEKAPKDESEPAEEKPATEEQEESEEVEEEVGKKES